MNGSLTGHQRSYRLLTSLYPRSFRLEYRSDLLQVFGDDVDERGAARAWARALSDLVVSVPVQHVEVTMDRSSRSGARILALPALVVLAGLAAFALGRFVVLTVPIALLASVALYWRSRRSYNEAVGGVSAAWWKVALAGVGVLAAIGIADTYGPDLEWFPWHVAVLVFLIGWVLLISGGILAAVRLTRHLRHRPAGSF